MGELEPQGVLVQRVARRESVEADGHRLQQRGTAAGAQRHRQLFRQRGRRLVGSQQYFARQVRRRLQRRHPFRHQQRVRARWLSRCGDRGGARSSPRRFRADARSLGCRRRGLHRLAAVRPVERSRIVRAAVRPCRVARARDQRWRGQVGDHDAAADQHARRPARCEQGSRRHRARQIHLRSRRLSATPAKPRL